MKKNSPQCVPEASARIAFAEGGFAMFPGFASAQEVTEIAVIVEDLIKNARWDCGFATQELIWIYKPEGVASALADLPSLRKAREVVAALTGSLADDIAVSTRLFYKPARFGSVTPWHQDRAYVQPSAPKGITAWLPLDEVSPDNGCLAYGIGSHRRGLATHVKRLEVNGLEVLEAEPPQRAIVLPMSAGDCVFHDDLTMHSSGPNLSLAPRRALSIRCELKC